MNITEKINKIAYNYLADKNITSLLNDIENFYHLDDSKTIAEADFFKLLSIGYIFKELQGIDYDILNLDNKKIIAEHSFSKELEALTEMALWRLKSNQKLYNDYYSMCKIFI